MSFDNEFVKNLSFVIGLIEILDFDSFTFVLSCAFSGINTLVISSLCDGVLRKLTEYRIIGKSN